MNSIDYDDPEVEEQWCQSMREKVMAYLAAEGLGQAAVGEWPAWHIAPYASIWAIESLKRPNFVGWWAVAGDIPCDYISAQDASGPRQAMRAIASRWKEMVPYLLRGENHPDIHMGDTPETRMMLGEILSSRVECFLEWVADPEIWEEPDPE